MDTELGLALNFLAILSQSDTACDLKGTSPRDDSLIVIDILDCAETVSGGFLDHGDGVLVGSLDEDGAGTGVLHSLHEGVLLLAQNVLLHAISITQIRWVELFDRVYGLATAGKNEALHVSTLGSAESDDADLGEHLQTDRVNTLLVDNHEAGSVGHSISIADLVFQFNDLSTPLIGELPFALGHFITVASIGEEELGVDFSLLVFERDIAGEDVALLQTLGHVGMPATVIQHQSAHELSITGQPVHHVHDLDHVEIEGLLGDLDDANRVDHDVYELVGKIGVQLGAEGSPGNAHQQWLLGDFLHDLEFFKESERLLPGQLVPLGDDTWVDLLLDQPLRLFHHLSDEEDVGGGAVADDIILGGG